MSGNVVSSSFSVVLFIYDIPLPHLLSHPSILCSFIHSQGFFMRLSMELAPDNMYKNSTKYPAATDKISTLRNYVGGGADDKKISGRGIFHLHTLLG